MEVPRPYNAVLKLKLKTVKEWLNHQDEYTVLRPVRRHFKRRPIITGAMHHQYQAVLIDFGILKKKNSDVYSHLMTCINVFSKWACRIPINTKTGVALTRVIGEICKYPQSINFQVDNCSEFVNIGF